MAGSRKKVIVRRFSPGLMWGFLPQTGLIQPAQPGGSPDLLALLDLEGRVLPLPLSDVKHVSYVRDFNTGDAANPERLQRKTFIARPRTEGLWLRLTLRDGDRMEGLAALDLALADGWAIDLGVHLVPPDTRGNTQRLYIPRSAIESMETVAVVTTPSRKKTVLPTKDDSQPDLFSMALPPDARTH